MQRPTVQQTKLKSLFILVIQRLAFEIIHFQNVMVQPCGATCIFYRENCPANDFIQTPLCFQRLKSLLLLVEVYWTTTFFFSVKLLSYFKIGLSILGLCLSKNIYSICSFVFSNKSKPLGFHTWMNHILGNPIYWESQTN